MLKAMDSALYGGIEAGGTKFICVVGTNSGKVQDKIQIPTTSPDETMQRVAEFFKNYPTIAALGVGSFGPIDLDPSSETYGCILQTPKQPWINYNLLAPLRNLCPRIALDTDVNCSAIGEQEYGAGKGQANFIYLTIGTGIGGSCVVDNKILKGATHSELGHMFVPLNPEDQFAGSCPYHGNCFEGLASGPSIQKRWGSKPATLAKEHQAWDLESKYIAYALVNIITIVVPQRIILGGGVMNHEGLLERIQKQVPELLGQYIHIDALRQTPNDYICLPQLGEMSAAVGAIHMASQLP
jgi:fructokinase